LRKELGLDGNGTEAPAAEVEEVARRLMAIMAREIDGVKLADDDWGTDSIARLNLDSLALIGFLVAVEDELGIEWDPNIDTNVLRSFDAMARYVVERNGHP
jgi:acyl carrier protein